MKTNLLVPFAAFAVLGVASSGYAQSGTVTNTAAPAPEAAPAQANAPVPTPNQIVYRATLPSPQEVTNAASAQGLTVEQINQSAGEVIAVYRTQTGQTMTVAYALLPTASNGVSPSSTVAAVEYAPAGTVVSTGTPSTTVVYTDPYYYDPVYSPWYYGYGWAYPGLAVGIGFGGYWSHGHYYRGGYYHGGYNHGGYNHGGYRGTPGNAHGNARDSGPIGDGHSNGGFHSGGGFHH